MMHLLFKVGPLPPYADSSKVKVMRKGEDGKEKEIIVDAKKLLKEGKSDDDITLENGDRVVVPERRMTLFE
jgi:protein involved in polysaccharide export with SLBB domain